MINPYTDRMKDMFPLPDIPGYVDIKEAARILGVAESSIYRYIQSGRLSAYQAGRNIMVELEVLKTFKPNAAGRPRKKSPPWHISPDTNPFYVIYMHVEVKEGKLEALKRAIQTIKEQESHLFSGTLLRYISLNNTSPVSVTIQLVWRNNDLPDDTIRELEITAFKENLADLLHWQTARYTEGVALIHT